MSQELTPEQTTQIADALAAGSKLEAIKLYREFSGKGLKEAKDFIDLLVPQLAQRDPAKYAKLAQQGKGCASVVVACLAVTAVVLVLLLR